jgi:hypothetical protein
MGYDLYLERSESDLARSRCMPLEDYYQLNLHGMALIRFVLIELGVLVGDGEPDCSSIPPVVAGDLDVDDQPLTPAGLAFEQARRRVLEAAPEFGAGVWKLLSNDGWLLTPRECAFIAAAIDLTDDITLIRLDHEAEAFYAELMSDLVFAEVDEPTDDVRLRLYRDFADFCRRGTAARGISVW